MKILITTMLLGATLMSYQQPEPRLPIDNGRFIINEKGKIGFINTSGEVVIPTQFEAAEEFSEGLCAVRINGRFGFIDMEGNVKIDAVYDYATWFKEGLALVYLDSKPLFITTSGQRAFESSYAGMLNFDDRLAKVGTASGKVGMIDRKGRLVIDTAYARIEQFVDGLAVVTEWIDEPARQKGKTAWESLIKKGIWLFLWESMNP